MSKAKPFVIDKRLVWQAYKKVKANKGSAGVDGVTLEKFEENLEDNLYKIWNRMSSGSYFPPAVKVVEIPKLDGRMRPLGIPTIADRIAQTVLKLWLEPKVEPYFHPDSYAYRADKSAHDALGKARVRCWRKDWVIDMDIKGFFDHLDHGLVLKALRKHTEEPWVLLYAERWLKAPAQNVEGDLVNRDQGTPQGGVVSPLLANLFMHYAFDLWMSKEFPLIEFERYADDIIVHTVSLAQAEYVLDRIRCRMRDCGLALHPEKTKIVYCQDDSRQGSYKNTQFDFLGYTFRKRGAKTRKGELFNSFLPAISDKAMKMIRDKCNRSKLYTRLQEPLVDVLSSINPMLRGWLNYYGKFYKSKVLKALRPLEQRIVKWVTRKYKTFKRQTSRARKWLKDIAGRDPQLFPLWLT